MQQFAIIKTGYRSKKQSDIKFYYLADFANCVLGFGLCKVEICAHNGQRAAIG